MKNHKGLSYIELILAMSIMFVLIGMVSFTIGLVGRANVNKASDRFISKINESRNMSLSKGTRNGILLIKKEGNSYYTSIGCLDSDDDVDESKTNWVRLCQNPVDVQYYVSGTGYVTVGSDIVKVKFKQSTGELIEGPQMFRFANGDKFTDVKIYSLTGKAK